MSQRTPLTKNRQMQANSTLAKFFDANRDVVESNCQFMKSYITANYTGDFEQMAQVDFPKLILELHEVSEKFFQPSTMEESKKQIREQCEREWSANFPANMTQEDVDRLGQLYSSSDGDLDRLHRSALYMPTSVINEVPALVSMFEELTPLFLRIARLTRKMIIAVTLFTPMVDDADNSGVRAQKNVGAYLTNVYDIASNFSGISSPSWLKYVETRCHKLAKAHKYPQVADLRLDWIASEESQLIHTSLTVTRLLNTMLVVHNDLENNLSKIVKPRQERSSEHDHIYK